MKSVLLSPLIVALALPLASPTIAAEKSCAPQPARKAVSKRSVKKLAPTPAPAPGSPYQQALHALKNGRVAEAHGLLQRQLQLLPGHEAARALLATLHLEAGRPGEAEAVLQAGQQSHPDNVNFAMSLARLQADRGALNEARATLARSAPHAGKNGDYLAFQAALAQEAGAHQEADVLLERALRLRPNHGAWLLAQARSRTALGNEEGPRTTYQAALASGTLSVHQKNQARLGLASLGKEKH